MIQSQIDPQIAAEHAQEIAEKGFNLYIFDSANLWALLLRFTFNMLICWIIIQFFYYRKSHRKDYYFTFMLFSVAVFLLLFLLESIPMQIGFALGLFAIFGMIRYRTESIQIREMTYLFVIIAISVVNGLASEVPVVSVIVANFLFILIIWVLESNQFLKHISTKIVLYEKIDLIIPERYDELLADLRNRTGLNITKVEVGHIDFLRDTAYLKVYYKVEYDEINTIDNIIRFP